MSESEGSFESADEGEKNAAAKKPTPTSEDLLDEIDKLVTETKLDSKPSGGDPVTAQPQEGKGNAEIPELDPEDDLTIIEKIAGAAERAKAAGWGWDGISSWGSNVMTTASTSVKTLADSVGGGIHAVLDTVENFGGPEGEQPPPADGKQSDSEKEKAGTPTDSSKSSTPQESSQAEGGGTPPGAEAGPEGGGSPSKEEKDAGWFNTWGIGGIASAVGQTVKKTAKDTRQAFKETGKSLMTGSLDVLESIGKKTYDVIAEGDHGIKGTIKKHKDKPNLSQFPPFNRHAIWWVSYMDSPNKHYTTDHVTSMKVRIRILDESDNLTKGILSLIQLLREAKEDADHLAKEEEEFAETRKAHYGAQFDEFQGLVQLEALEMLSNQCEGRVHGLLTSLRGEQLEQMKTELVAIKEAFQLENMEEEEDDEKDHDFDRLMADYIGKVGLNTTPEKLVQAQEKTRKWLSDCEHELSQEDGIHKTPQEVHQQAIQSLAEFTARSMEQFHKVGQLILLERCAPLSSYRTKSSSLASATRVLCTEVGIMSTKLTQILGKLANTSENPSSVNPLITNVYLEASNSSTYIQDAFLLLLPVLQQGAIESQQREQLLS